MTAVLNWFKNNFFVANEGTTKERKIDFKRLIIHFVAAFLVLVFIYLSYTIVKPLNYSYGTSNGGIARAYGTILILILVAIYIVLRINKKTNFEVNLFFIMAIGLVIRLTYMLYTPGHSRQHDTWSTNNNGHYDYALYIFENFSLPNHAFTEANVYQFYHPPLYYYVSAIWMHIYQAIGFNAELVKDTDALYCSVQILSTFFTFLSVWYAIKTLRLLNLNKTATYIAAIFLSFFPRLIQFSGQLNNDPLATLFIICSVFRFFKYKIEGYSYKEILLCALYLGLAMCTKLSAVIVSLGFASYFIYEFIRTLMKKEGSNPLKTMVIQYVAFILICAPIGLWFQLYSHNVYGLPFNFVFRNLNTRLFTGTRDYVLSHTYLNVNKYDLTNSGLIYTNNLYNFLARYVSPFYISDFESGIFASASNNYNILTYALKSLIFGEFKYWGGEAFGLVALVSSYILWFTLLVILVYLLIKKKVNTNYIFSWAITFSIIIFYLYLQYSMPYGCSMDARYIVSIFLPIGLIIAQNITLLDRKNKVENVFSTILIASSITYAVCSFGFYIFAI